MKINLKQMKKKKNQMDYFQGTNEYVCSGLYGKLY